MKNNIGLIGLAVMGQNLARNIASKGYTISVYNRTFSVTQEFTSKYSTNINGFETLQEFVSSLEAPRSIILLVKAGSVVDSVISELLPLLEKGDTIIDCGNSYWKDTERRQSLSTQGINFVGCGISGGEEGALKGPSIMPGIDSQDNSKDKLFEILQNISARDFNGTSCVTKVGSGGAGHFVKMVHNGIEYSMMQMIAESYKLFKTYGFTTQEISDIYDRYNKGRLGGYLIEISSTVLKQKDEFNDGFLVNYIIDSAGAKGTGLWTSIDGLENQSDVSSIISAVFARVNSGKRELRQILGESYTLPIFMNTDYSNIFDKSKEEFIDQIESLLYSGILLSYIQGLELIRSVSIEKKWAIDLSEVLRIWQGGCIIRAKVLLDLIQVSKSSESLLNTKFVIDTLSESYEDYKKSIIVGLERGVSMPSFSSALQYFNSMKEIDSGANMIQILRDHFGAHTYQRTDREGVFHTTWEF